MNLLLRTALILLLCAAFLPFQTTTALAEGYDFNADLSAFKTGNVNARASVHDPSIIRANGTYYIFGTHMTAASSTNLRNFDRLASDYTPRNPVWGNLFDPSLHVFDYAGGPNSLIPTDDGQYHVWAPDVIYNKTTGQYMMYYCTSSTWNASNLCFGTSDTIEGPYTWQANILCSGFSKSNIDQTDVKLYADEAWIKKNHLTLGDTYNYKKCPNALDPTVFYDKDDRLWMVYGSWSGGIFLLELDPATGLVIHPEADKDNDVDPYFGKKLMGGNHQSIEGPYILYDPDSDYYYLFVSYGSLTAHGGYQIRVFRSKEVDGEYLDMNGKKPGNAGHVRFGLKLSGNYTLPGVRVAYMATGHNSAFIDEDGKKYICYHTRYNNGTEGHSPMVKQYFLNAEGWPCMLPYATRMEEIAPVTANTASGRYYVIDQGTAINDEIAQPFIMYLNEDGTVVTENDTGVWTLTGDWYMTITLNEETISGIFCASQDDAGTPVLTFSAVGSNKSVWGVKYTEEE